MIDDDVASFGRYRGILSRTDRREALRLRRADLAAYNHEAVGYGGGFGIHCGGPCGVSTAAVVTAAVVVELSSIRDRVRKAGAVQHVCCRWFPRRH